LQRFADIVGKLLILRMDKKDVRVNNIGTKQHNEVKNIASHVGCSMGELIKKNLHVIIQQYPKDYREYPCDKD
jgi:hypothetical protein